MWLTRFSYAALCIDAGLLLGLFLSKIGWEAYGVTIFVTVVLVLAREWRAPQIDSRHEIEDA